MPVTDFDFLPGTWRVRNRKLTDALDPACDRWEEFDATSEAHADARRGREPRPLPRALAGYEGFSLRLYDPDPDARQGSVTYCDRKARAASVSSR